MKKILFIIAVLLSGTMFSQQKKINITWQASKTFSSSDYAVEIPLFSPEEHYSYSLFDGLNIVSQWKTNTYVNEKSAQLTNIKYQPISKGDLKGLDLKKIPSKIKVELKNSIAERSKFCRIKGACNSKVRNG
ncbi:type IX secretion system sortase PorU, long form [Lacinutrix neustonica]|uniref:type IX secretion system sortase PorU, long form n=1 Tax=Lacinutrix neustonica TaxID=2980107 RepID=UPI0028BE6F3C|nr:hypothetical protein [Lacinutrix neustonica]